MSSILTYIHSGAFSGSAASLRRALEERIALEVFDTMPLARDPRLFGWRIAAMGEAVLYGHSVPWVKTSAWSRAVQRRLARAGFLTPGTPLLVVQTLTALNPRNEIRYAVYTDRAGSEGAAAGGQWASRFSSGWLERESKLLQSAHRVFVMGPSTAQALLDHYHLDAERIKVVGAGPNATLSPARLRSEARRLLFVGTQWELKGGPQLLEAFGIVRRQHFNLELHIVGSKPPGDLPPGVTVVDRVPHDRMDDLYDHCDILVIPTHMEAFGISLLEGLLKGLPCIHSTVGNQRWLVGDAGVAVDPHRVEGLAAAISEVVENYPEFHRRAIVRGEALGPQMQWSQVADRILEDLLDT